MTDNKLSLKNQLKDKKSRIRFLTRVSMFSALSFLFYIVLKFPLAAIFPIFLEINFSMIFVLIGALSTGPLGATLICIIRFLLKIATTNTMLIGELSDLIIGLVVSVPTSFVYLKYHDKKGGFMALALSFILWILSSCLSNAFIVMPLYTTVGDITVDTIINSMSMIDGVTESNYLVLYIFCCCLPFNVLMAFINCGAAILVYKKISTLLKKMGV